MFQIDEYQDDDTFPAVEKGDEDDKVTSKGAASEARETDRRRVRSETLSPSSQELRRRIGSDPPLPEAETLDELGTFRARSSSAPPILWAAQRYGRELRRMSDEFYGVLQNLPRPKSAGTASQMCQATGWKETLRSWWHRRYPGNGPPRNPP